MKLDESCVFSSRRQRTLGSCHYLMYPSKVELANSQEP